MTVTVTFRDTGKDWTPSGRRRVVDNHFTAVGPSYEVPIGHADGPKEDVQQ